MVATKFEHLIFTFNFVAHLVDLFTLAQAHFDSYTTAQCKLDGVRLQVENDLHKALHIAVHEVTVVRVEVEELGL